MPDLWLIIDVYAEADNSSCRFVICLTAGARKKEANPESDLQEADLMKVLAEGQNHAYRLLSRQALATKL